MAYARGSGRKKKKKLEIRVADFFKTKMNTPKYTGMYHKPGSNKK